MRRLLLLALVSCSASSSESSPDEFGLLAPGLCDGSPDVRLVVTSRGEAPNLNGFASSGRFLIVNGKCEYVASGAKGTDRGLVTGTFSAAQAQKLGQQLHLDEPLQHRDTQTCVDAASTTILGPEANASCSCGCDANAPPAVSAAMVGMEAAFGLALESGKAWSGPLEVAVSEAPSASGRMIDSWPFSFPLAENVTLQALSARDFAGARSVDGEDASKARALRDAVAAREPAATFQQEQRYFILGVRDRLPPGFQAWPAAMARPSPGCLVGLDACAKEDVPPASYEICDGSDAVRFGMWTSGGFVDSSFWFLNPDGAQGMYVTGRCEFVASPRSGVLVRGTLTREQAAELAGWFDLGRIEGRSYFARGSTCPDAGTSYVLSANGYVERGCGIDPPPFASIAQDAEQRAMQLAVASGQPASGALTVAAIGRAASEGGPAWPLGSSIDELAVQQDLARGNPHFEDAAHTLAGADAAAVRALRTQAGTEREWFPVRANEREYRVYARDEQEPAFAEAIARFKKRNQSPTPKPLTICRGATLTAAFPDQTFVQRDGTYLARTYDPLPCGAQLCWDGSFAESETLSIALRVEAPAQPSACTEVGPLRADLKPVVERFHTASPKQPVRVAVTIAGANGQYNYDPVLYDLENEAKLCAALAPDACASDARCAPTEGRTVQGACTLPATVLGCGPSVNASDCYAMEVVGRAPDGRTASFASTCLPEGWREYSYQRVPACVP